MSDHDTPGVWPRWARWLVLGALGAILVAALVLTIAGGGVRGVVVRMIVAAVVVPALLLPVQLIGLRHRAGRTRDRLAGQLHELRLLVVQEDAASAPAVVAQIEAISRQLPGAPPAELRRMVDHLAPDTTAGSVVARALAGCRRTARRLDTTSRRTARGRTRGFGASTGVTRDGRSFRAQPRWKEQVVYWEDGRGFVLDAGWGVDPPVLYVPSARLWDEVVPDWMAGRRSAVVDALRESSGHVLREDDHGWYRSAPDARVLP